jgi:hypothetical protein
VSLQEQTIEELQNKYNILEVDRQLQDSHVDSLLDSAKELESQLLLQDKRSRQYQLLLLGFIENTKQLDVLKKELMDKIDNQSIQLQTILLLLQEQNKTIFERFTSKFTSSPGKPKSPLVDILKVPMATNV